MVITVIGSGGKTTLIWNLATSVAALAGRKVLVSPTTKMLVPNPEENLYDRYYNHNENKLPCESDIFKPESGITLAGSFNDTSGKLEPLPREIFDRFIPGYDLVLIEGDGAKTLPLKAWAAHEPVVPHFTTLTIGVLPLWPLGKPVSEELVHRLPLFLSLTGAAMGEPLKPKHFLPLITGSKIQPGLFAKARGKKLLFFNGDDEVARQAQEIVSLLPAEFRDSLSGIITRNLHS
jgi:probable selenium-dependent hydroxylase accessory protein YqeC